MEVRVSGMTCGHCEKAVTRAVLSVDPSAAVTVERGSGRVSVRSGADPDAVKRAIEGEGYVVVEAGGAWPDGFRANRGDEA